MKTIAKTGIVLFIGLTFSNCGKKKEVSSNSQDVSANETEESGIFKEELYASTTCNFDASAIDAPCAVITQTSIDFPKTVTIDFGTGCTDAKGRVKKGKIIIVVSDDIRILGATRKVSFDNFYINDRKIEGTRNATNIGLSAAGNHKIEVIGDLTVTKDGKLRRRTFTRVREWTAGAATCVRIDDEFSITGSGSIENSDGKMVTWTITEALIYKVGTCKYVTQGKMDVARGNREGVLDFGAGECDNIAKLTLSNGKVKTINLDTHKFN